MKWLTTLFLLLMALPVYSQNAGIGDTGDFDPDPSAVLELRSKSRGLLLPRMTKAERVAISSPAHGLLVIQTDTDGSDIPGIYYYNQPDATWYRLNSSGPAASTGWQLLGNSGTNPATNFIGTTDATGLSLRTNSVEQIRVSPAGNIGIGTNSPTQKIELANGNLLLSNSTNISGEIWLAEPSGSGNNYVSFKSPALASDIKYTLPAAINSTNSYLSTDAAGNLSWQTLPAASQDWTILGNAGTNPATNFIGTTDNTGLSFRTNNTEKIYVSPAGYVGFGTNTPTQKIDIMNGGLQLSNNNNTPGELRFYEPSASGINYSAFKAKAQPSNITYVLPDTLSKSKAFLSVDTLGNMQWTNVTAITGDMRWNITTIVTSNAYTATDNDSHILVNYNGTCTVTLPTGSFYDGKMYFIKNINPSESYTVNVVPSGSDTIEGYPSITLYVNNKQYIQGVQIVHSHTNWYVMTGISGQWK